MRLPGNFRQVFLRLAQAIEAIAPVLTLRLFLNASCFQMVICQIKGERGACWWLFSKQIGNVAATIESGCVKLRLCYSPRSRTGGFLGSPQAGRKRSDSSGQNRLDLFRQNSATLQGEGRNGR
jgi:hypothetical protein